MPVTSYLKSNFQKAISASAISLSFALTACADQSTVDAASAPELTQKQTHDQEQQLTQDSHNGSHEDHDHDDHEDHDHDDHEDHDHDDHEDHDHDDHENHDHGDHEDHDHGADASPMIFPAVDFATTEAPEDHVIGEATAPITVISYASVTCPHCGDWFTKDWPQFKSELIETGRVRFIFREFPTQPVQLAMAGFLIANCADESRFFEAIEYQMENQKSIFESAQAGTAKETYVAIAQKFGLKDEAEMQACLSNQEEVNRIETSMARAHSANVKGAPAFIINETLFEGNPSYASLKAAIDLESETGVSKMDKR